MSQVIFSQIADLRLRSWSFVGAALLMALIGCSASGGNTPETVDEETIRMQKEARDELRARETKTKSP